MPKRRLSTSRVALGVVGSLLVTACSAFGDEAGNDDGAQSVR